MLRAARHGLRDARGQLLDLYWRYLLTLAAEQIDGKLRPKIGLSDAAQETLVRADQNFEKFTDGSVREWEAWLRTLALNTIADLRRRFASKKRNIRRELPLDGVDSRTFLEKLSTLNAASAHQVFEGREAAERALAAVRLLRPSHQAVILWRFRDGLSNGEIAEKLERSEDAVRMLLHRALLDLQRRLGDSHEA